MPRRMRLRVDRASIAFTSLSTELIVDVLCRLHYLDIVCCRQVCRQLQTIVDSTPLLQYIVEFGAAGNFPARKPGSSVVEALEELRRVHTALRDPHPRLHRNIPLQFSQTYGTRPFPGFVSRMHVCGDSLVGFLDDDSMPSRLGILSLRSEDMPMEQRFRVLEFDVLFPFFFVDVQEDLIILFNPEVLHFRSFTTGQIHPKLIRRADGSFTTSHIEVSKETGGGLVQVYGDWLLVDNLSLGDGETYQCLWHWPTGRRVQEWPFTPSMHYVRAGCLCEGFLFVPNLGHTHSLRKQVSGRLDVFALPDDCNKPLTRVASYEIPSGLHKFRVSTTPSDKSADPTNLQSRAALLYITVRGHYLLVKVDALTRDAAKYASVPLVDGCIPWEVWGPTHTRNLQLDAQHNIFGYTALLSDEVWSFNALDIAHDLYAPKPSWGSQAMDVFDAPTSLPVLKGAEKPMATRLAYRRTPIWVPADQNVFELGTGSEDDILVCVEDGGPKIVRIAVKVLENEDQRVWSTICLTHLEIFALCH